MKKIVSIFFLLFLHLLQPAVAQGRPDTLSTDTAAVRIPAVDTKDKPADDEFNLFLFAFALTALALMAGAALIGILVTAAALVTLGALLLFGIISVSALAALKQKSATAGFRTFLYIFSILLGAVIGMGGFALIIWLLQLDIPYRYGIIAGTLGGLAGGYLMALGTISLLRAGFRMLQKRFN